MKKIVFLTLFGCGVKIHKINPIFWYRVKITPDINPIYGLIKLSWWLQNDKTIECKTYVIGNAWHCDTLNNSLQYRGIKPRSLKTRGSAEIGAEETHKYRELGFSKKSNMWGNEENFYSFFILLINFHKEKSRVKMSNMTTLLIIDSLSAE